MKWDSLCIHSMQAKVTGDKVIVKTMPEGTKFVTLDGVERTLTDRDLMICNTEEAMCIGGVFGGLDSGVTEQTTDVFLESACFHPTWIRKTARRFGLNTDASFRFERGLDANNTIYVLKRAALLIQEVAGGKDYRIYSGCLSESGTALYRGTDLQQDQQSDR